MDALSDVLSLLKPRSYSCAGFDVGGSQSVRMPEHEGIVCYAVVSGQLWLSIDSNPEPMLLRAGDCIVLPTGQPFTTATDLGVPATDAVEAMQLGEVVGSVRYYNGGGKCFVIASHFEVDGKYAEILLSLLSPVVHIRSDEDRATLRSNLERMQIELHNPQPGSALVVEHLAHLILVQALRMHLAEGGVGWLFALADKAMGAAISAMHADPAHPWTVESLAKRAGMSRTSFAVRFKEAVGASPLEYLRRWRMLLAGNKLTTTGESVSAIALSLGYESESAFSAAFTKVMGVSPRRYGRGRVPELTA